MADAGGGQLGAGLSDDLAPMRQDENGLPGAHGGPHDVGRDDRLARAGRRDQHDAPVTGGDLALDIGDHDRT